MSEEDEIKKEMLQKKAQEQIQSQIQQPSQKEQVEQMLKEIIPKVLNKKARERLNMIKTVKPDLATQLQLYLLQLYRSGQIQKPMDEETLKKILKQINQNKEINIKRK